MKDGFNVQKKFFQELKIKLPPNYSLANVVADALNISIDSAYRRIRGESDLSFREFDILSSKYAVSTDAVLSKSHQSINFNYPSLQHEHFDVDKYIKSIVSERQSLMRYGLREITYLAKDLPVFYYFMCPALASFKIFSLLRNGAKMPDSEDYRYNSGLLRGKDLEKIRAVQHGYLAIPSIEIWSEETLNCTLRQLAFYDEIGAFENRKDIVDILNELKQVVGHVQIQAELGYKIALGKNQPSGGRKDNFKMYYNELPLSENLTLLRLNGSNMTQLGNDPNHRLSTNNEDFFKLNYTNALNIMKQAYCLSIHCQNERKHFFNLLYHKIDHYIANL